MRSKISEYTSQYYVLNSLSRMGAHRISDGLVEPGSRILNRIELDVQLLRTRALVDRRTGTIPRGRSGIQASHSKKARSRATVAGAVDETKRKARQTLATKILSHSDFHAPKCPVNVVFEG